MTVRARCLMTGLAVGSTTLVCLPSSCVAYYSGAFDRLGANGHRISRASRTGATGGASRNPPRRLRSFPESSWTEPAFSRRRHQQTLSAASASSATATVTTTSLTSTTLDRNRCAYIADSDEVTTIPIDQYTTLEAGEQDKSSLTPPAFKNELASGVRRKKKGKEPELVIEGDKLVNTPKMLGLTYVSLFLLAAYFAQGVSMIVSPWQAGWTAAGVGAGVLLADLVSGVFHWSVDNYGNGNTPVFGSVIEAFQGHHASPWTITYRPFENNVHKICFAVLPLLAALRLVNPGPAGVAFGVTFLFGSLMSQEFHRYAHMTKPPKVVAALQDWGVIIGRRNHGQHHTSPFEEKYCIVNGACNEALDKSGAFRFLEKKIFEINGVEPICWTLDPSVKEAALNGNRG